MILECPHCHKPWHPITREEQKAAALEIAIQSVFEAAEDRFGVDTAAIAGRAMRVAGQGRRFPPIRRWVAIQLRELGLTYEGIGQRMGNRDHSTIIAMVQEVKRKRK